MNTTPSTPTAGLYLRQDGSIMAVRGSAVVDLKLTPSQLLQLGMDALAVASQLNPGCIDEAASACLRSFEKVFVQNQSPEVHQCPPQVN